MACIGIDLGTTNSLIAVFDESGARLLPNALGEVMTPSAVGLADDGQTLLVGRAAKARLIRHPQTTASRFKRLMGTGRTLPMGKRTLSAVELSAMVLRALKADAEAQLGQPVTEAVVSVPAYFNGVQRQATKDAAEIAGLTVRNLINEPTAAALAAGVLDREGESTFVVLDLGGGTFDVSILEMFEGVMEVRASAGDAFLGGDDFTASLARHFAKQHDLDWDQLDPPPREVLLNAADQIKMHLSNADTASATVTVAGRELALQITQDGFEELTADLVARLRKPIEASLYDAQMSIDRIDRVILVGGATRMPVIRSLAAKVFRRLPERAVDPDHAIALGAAIQAGLVARHQGLSDMVMTDVSPFSLGIAVAVEVNGKFLADRFTPLIERNTILPASRADQFATVQDNQMEIALKVYQGESIIASENVQLGEFFVSVPKGPKGSQGIEVRFTYDTSGLLAVDAEVLTTGKVLSNVIENLAEALSPAEKARRLREMQALKVAPRDQAANQAMLERLKHLYAILLGEDRQLAARLIAQFEQALASQDPRVIEAARAKLADLATALEAGYVR